MKQQYTGILSIFTLNTLTLVCMFSILFFIRFLRCWLGEFVYQSRASLVSWWSFPLSLWPYCVIQGWLCKEKLDASQRGVGYHLEDIHRVAWKLDYFHHCNLLHKFKVQTNLPCYQGCYLWKRKGNSCLKKCSIYFFNSIFLWSVWQIVWTL